MGKKANPAHRGRLQVQGDDMNPERSAAWAQESPKTADSALDDLSRLHDGCTHAQRARRELAFVQARRFISNARAGGGVPAPVSESFPGDERYQPEDFPNARVDIEVKRGMAFV
jgi:hypothetical protein